MEADDSVERPVRIRRNAKQASCEPCRISKVRCSHDIPCARCIRNGRPEDCIVHPAPMTRRTNAPSSASSKAESQTPPISGLRSPDPFNLGVSTTFGAAANTNTQLSPIYRNSTGFSPLFMEMDEFSDFVEEGDTLAELSRTTSSNQTTYRLMKFCLSVLTWLPSRTVAQRILGEWLDSALPVHYSILSQRQLEDFWSAYGDLLEEPRSNESLTILADQLCVNTRQELPIPQTNSEWVDLISGPKTRWQFIGELFAWLGHVSHLCRTQDVGLAAILPLNTSPREYALSMLNCANSCLTICDQLDSNSNMLTVQLMTSCNLLHNTLLGGSGLVMWKKIGTTMSALTGLGLHRNLEGRRPVSPAYNAQRSRIFASAYVLEKSMATLGGRPPILSRRLVSTELPSDISDTEILFGDLSISRAQFGRDGWNKDERIRVATQLRVELMQSMMRDEILELQVASRSRNVSPNITMLRTRLAQHWEQLPGFFHQAVDEVPAGALNDLQIICICMVKLNHLQSIFLVERIQHVDFDEQAFKPSALEILKTVMWMWNQHGTFGEKVTDLVHWFISYYGLAAADALTIDLWRQMTSRYGQSNTQDRSLIIQDLSLFLICLDWVRPEDGNYELCNRVRGRIRTILDRILTPNASQGVNINQYSHAQGIADSNVSTNEYQTYPGSAESWPPNDTTEWSRQPGPYS